MSHTMRRFRASRVMPSYRKSRIMPSFIAVMFLFMASTMLMFGPMSGESFALYSPPVPSPSIPLSVTPSSTITGVGEVPFFTSAAVDTGVGIVGADATVDGGVAAAGICAAATLGTCAVAAVAVLGAAYLTYKTLGLSWGPHHVMQPTPNPTASYTIGPCSQSTGYPGNYLYGYISGNLLTYGQVGGSMTVTNGAYTSPTCTTGPEAWNNLSGLETCANGATHTGFSFSSISGPGTTTVTNGCTAGEGGFASLDWKYTPSSSQNGYPGSQIYSRYSTGPAPTLPKHQVTIQQQCLTSAGSLYTTITTTSGQFDDSQQPPNITAQACPQGTVPGSSSVNDTFNNTATTLYQMPQPKLDPSNPCSAVGAGCMPQLQHLTDTKQWVDDKTDQPSRNLDGTFRCEWKSSGGLDGGNLPMSDCVGATGQPDPGGTDAQPRTTPDDKSCWSGIASWNPVDWVYTPVKCVLKWAFVPPAGTMQQWNTKATNLKTSFPINVMVSGVTDIHTVVDIWNTCVPNCPGDGSLNGGFAVPGTTTHFDPLANAGDTMQNNPKGRSIYALGQVAIIGGFVFWAWRRISSSFGGKESTA